MDDIGSLAIGPRLMAALERGRAIVEETVGKLDGAALEENGAGEKWSFKDNIHHIAAWQQHNADLLTAVTVGTTPESAPDETASLFNEKNLEVARTLSWPQVWEYYTSANDALEARLAAASEAALTGAALAEWTDGAPLWDPVLVDGFIHVVEHISRFNQQLGNTDYAVALYRQEDATLRELFGDTQYGTIGPRDLAKFYVESGNKAEAIATLRAALQETPFAKGFVKDDPAFEPLRDDPDFMAITS